MEYVFLTKNGYDNFKKELDLLTENRKEAVKSLTRARDMGDLSENGFYKAARHELSTIDRRIRELTYMLKYAKIIENPSSGIAGLGSSVVVVINGEERIYRIVGRYEANPKMGMVSNESPIGKILLGKKAGEKFTLETDTKYSYEIVSVN
jgi:transcription elongation factor GreA